MALVIIYAVLSHFDFVAKFTRKNQNKDFANTVGETSGDVIAISKSETKNHTLTH